MTVQSSQKTWLPWVKTMSALVLLSAVAVPGLNLAIDPYSVFGTADYLKQGSSVNERFGKVEHLLKHPLKHDSFIIGSSTMGLFDPPKSNWYNLAFLAGTPPEALRALRSLKNNGVAVKEVAMGLDIFAFRKLEKSHRNSQREHPLATGQSRYGWLTSNLFASSAVDMLDRVQNHLEDQPRIAFDIQGTGRYCLHQWDREISANHNKYIQTHLRYKGTETDVSVTLVEQRFTELNELAIWLKDNGVQAHFWINPIHHSAQGVMDAETKQQFRGKITSILGNIADYSRQDEICNDDTLFYDYNHFRPAVAQRIMQEVLR